MNENQKILLGILGVSIVATILGASIKQIVDKKLLKK